MSILKTASQKTLLWIGRVISLICVFPFAFGAAMMLSGSPEVAKGMDHLGIPPTLMNTIIGLKIACVAIYLIPQTAVLGAILLTGYLGGAILTHLRVGEPVPVQVALGVLIWLGLWLREPKLWQVLPFRKK